MASLSNLGGRGSDRHCLLGNALTHEMTSDIVGASNIDNEDPLYLWYSAGPTLAVLLLTPLIVIYKPMVVLGREAGRHLGAVPLLPSNLLRCHHVCLVSEREKSRTLTSVDAPSPT